MRRWLLTATILVLSPACSIGRAQEDVSSSAKAAADRREKSDSLAERFKSLRKEVDDAEAAYLEVVDEYVRVGDEPVPAEVRDRRKRAWRAYTSTADRVMPQVVELARKNPKAEATFEALEWVVVSGRQAAVKEWGVQATEILRDHHARSPNVAPVCAALGHRFWGQERHEPARDFLRAVARQNPDRSARGLATFGLATGIETWARRLSRGYSGNIGHVEEQPIAEQGDPEWLLDEAETLFEQVLADYADVKEPFLKRPLGELAKSGLFEARHLAIGSKAPEIEGEDIDGTPFKLSDYRGKVIVLYFWGHW